MAVLTLACPALPAASDFRLSGTISGTNFGISATAVRQLRDKPKDADAAIAHPGVQQ